MGCALVTGVQTCALPISAVSSASDVGERVPSPTTGVTVGQQTMSAKRLTALVPITNQLIRRASMNVQMMIRDDLVEGVAVKEDQQFLRGVGSATAPTGMRNLIAAEIGRAALRGGLG